MNDVVDKNSQEKLSNVEIEESSELKTTTTTDSEKCPICLQKFSKSKSYASQCFHSFCFECLLQWTQIKHNCPLCKRSLDRIVFELKSALEFKEYALKAAKESVNVASIEIIAYLPAAAEQTSAINGRQEMLTQVSQSKPEQVSKASWQVGREQSPIEFRMLVYLNGWYVNPKQTQLTYKIESLDAEFGLNEEREEGVKVKPDNSNGLVCNRYKTTRHFRTTTPEWYRKNPLCARPLMQFIYRELKAIAGALAKSKLPNYLNQIKRYQLLKLLTDLVKKVDVNSEEFLREVKEFIGSGEMAVHFRHELSAFASSAARDLIDYDSKCVYYASSKAVSALNSEDVRNKLPLTFLPVNLSKYRLMQTRKEELIELLDEEGGERAGDVGEEAVVVVSPSTSSSVVLVDTRLSDNSEYSSYCEEVEAAPKKSPQYIYLSSSSSSSPEKTLPRRSLKRSGDESEDSSKPRCSRRKKRRTKHSNRSRSSSRKKERSRKEKKKKKSSSKSKRSDHHRRKKSRSFSSTSRSRSRSRSKYRNRYSLKYDSYSS